jgi:hypothetical protein
MPPAADLRPFVAAIEERIGFTLDEPLDGAYGIVVDGIQMVNVRLDADSATATISAPVNAGSRGLPRRILAELLEFNFPSNQTAGATLGAEPGSDSLELINDFSLRAIRPDVLANIVAAQGKAAIDVNRWINRRLARPA